MNYEDPIIDKEELAKANQRCDEDLKRLGIFNLHNPGRVGSGWKPQSMIKRGELTDRKIDKYKEQGFYSPEMKEARNKKRNYKRIGNYIQKDGEMIYSPIQS